MDAKLLKLLNPKVGGFFALFLVFCLACAFVSIPLSLVGFVLWDLALVYYILRMRARTHGIEEYLLHLKLELKGEDEGRLLRFPLPTLLALSATGEVLWCNDLFLQETEQKDVALKKTLYDLFPSFDTRWLKEGKPIASYPVQMGGEYYSVYGQFVKDGRNATALIALYFLPCSEVVELRETLQKTRPAVSILSIDNYEELTKNGTDFENSSILAAIDQKIGAWAKDSGALLRKYDRDKYMFVVTEQVLDRLAEQKFFVLDDVRTLQNREGISATLSIGVGRDGETLEECFSFAGLALDMALSRGGDQAIIKNKFAFEFFGGLSKEVEKRTKVKTRVLAGALVGLIRDASQVMIMGHKMSDHDAVGAAIGMVCAVRSQEKPVHVVINTGRTTAMDLIHKIQALPLYKDVFINPEEAMVMCDASTLLIVVDTNRPDFVESPPLLESINTVAVIDHHRRAASYIENCAVNLHEPYASSTCELVAELLQYMVPNRTILREEAECVLAGIYLDTKGFTIKAGVRTFEAAAYLKRAGADMVGVKKLFQTTLDAYMQRQRLIAHAKDIGNGIVLAMSSEKADRATAAKAADELLSIIGVQASIVAFPSGSDTIVSARSLGNINVQLMMENLGGGGSLASAGAQLANTNLEQAEAKIREATTLYFEKMQQKNN